MLRCHPADWFAGVVTHAAPKELARPTVSRLLPDRGNTTEVFRGVGYAIKYNYDMLI